MKNQKGFSLVELLVVVIIIAIIAAIAIPSLLASRRAANEASAVQSMRTYHSAQATFQALDPARNYAIAPTNLAAYVDSILSGAGAITKSGYTLNMVGVAASGSTPTSYCAGAVPLNATSGTNNYAVDSGNGGVVVSGGATLVCAAGAIGGGPGTPVQ